MKTSAQTRRDPQKGKKEFSTSKGFTIIELMVVIAVIAIVTSFALPSYQTLIEKRQVTSGTQQIAAFLSSAKMEAIKRNEKVAISTSTDGGGDWCIGYIAYEANAADDDAACDCSISEPATDGACAIDEFGNGTMVLRTLMVSQLNKPIDITDIDLGGGDSVVIFDPIRGMLVADDTVQLPLEVKSLSKHQTYALNVRLTATGRVSICSDLTGDTIRVPGYDQCEVLE